MNKKKGVSNILAVVIIVGIMFSLSVGLYAWYSGYLFSMQQKAERNIEKKLNKFRKKSK